ncbi:hypothetical protein NEAUS06_0166 [Nematocida ausubeli]|nr:hypothetical protein NEAUS06_0166 [Nematocida ausubeli]
MTAPIDINWGRKEQRRPISKTQPYTFFTFSNPKKRKADDQVFAPRPIIRPQADVPAECQPGVPHHERLLKVNLVLQAYLSLIFNAFVVGLVVLLLIKGAVMLKNDIEVRINASIIDQKTQIADCAREYRINRCSPEERVPAMEKQCQVWEKCMTQDPIRQELGKIILRLFSEGAEELMSALSVRSVLLASFALIIILRFRK